VVVGDVAARRTVDNPIEHVVIIFKENHTVDNYFGQFPGVDGVASPLPTADDPIADPLHDHAAWLVSKSGSAGVAEQYGRSNIAAYWAYAQQFTLCDRYFSDVASQSEPNHLFAIAADSPVIDNSGVHKSYQPHPPYNMPSLPATLESAGRTWRGYADPLTSFMANIADLRTSAEIVPAARFDTDLTSDSFPAVSWLYPPEGLSEHPGDWNEGAVLPPGVAWTAARVAAAAASAYCPRLAIFLTWDCWGGWSDHVAPPHNRSWTGGGHPGYRGSQFRFGNRVPLLVISPYARQGVNHDMSSHASLVKFCIRLFGLQPWDVPALAADDPAGDLWNCFDFTSPPRLAPPSRPAM
jgi:phospholipase C